MDTASNGRRVYTTKRCHRSSDCNELVALFDVRFPSKRVVPFAEAVIREDVENIVLQYYSPIVKVE